MMEERLLLLALILLLPLSAVDCQSDGIGEWQILTKQNYSSQIRLHPHILLLVTVPWSGESRTLMKELAHLVNDRQVVFSSLKLRYMYRTTEKMLAESVGAVEGVTVLYYHHSASYKYRGRLRAHNILYSFYPYMSVLPEELPLQKLNSAEDLKKFLDSTDKALILLEFCGWTSRLLATGKTNGTETAVFLQGFHEEADRMSMSRRKVAGFENGKQICRMENAPTGIPWVREHTVVNSSFPLHESKNTNPGGGSCIYEEFQQFESFFSKFITTAQEFFLPSEKHRFGLVSERSFLSSLGISSLDSWLSMVYLTGCPSCSKIIKEEKDLKSALQIENSFIAELEVDWQDVGPALPADKPSILLFLDRFSESSEIRRKGKEALIAFRKLALDYQISHKISWQENDKPEKLSIRVYPTSRSTTGRPRLKFAPTAQKIKVKDTMSIMVMNEGKHVTLENIASDLQGSSLHEILSYLLEKKKETKFSSLAKELGFHLLSDDFDVKLVDTSPSQSEAQPKQVLSLMSEERLVTNSVDMDKNELIQRENLSDMDHEERSEVPNVITKGLQTEAQCKQVLLLPSEERLATNSGGMDKNELIQRESLSDMRHEERAEVPDVKPSSHFDKEVASDTSKQLASMKLDQLVPQPTKDGVVEADRNFSPQADKWSTHVQGFRGSFFLSDGDYQLLRDLTGGSTIPSLVLVDPILQQHFVFPEQSHFNYSSLVNFLHEYLNGTLHSYQRSGLILENLREATHPPFVNMDFHEVDSIPRVTTHAFSELVLGFKRTDSEITAHAWNEDVLVLFSTSWCGFCQRMELVVREVYRAIKGYMKILKSGSRSEHTVCSCDDQKNAILKPPQIYLMDCTLNDCSLILKTINQREVYPALMLFPAERKKAVSYEGDVAVTHIIKFIAEHGSNSHHLVGQKGIPQTVAEGGRNKNLFDYSAPSTFQKDVHLAKDKLHDVLLKHKTEKMDEYNQIESHSSRALREKLAAHVVVGSILIATDKLISTHPFDKSKILIVKADQDSGVLGLIFNRHMKWDSLQELEEGMEFLSNSPLSFGGPVIQREMPLVALTRKIATRDQFPEVGPGLYFLDQLATVREIERLKSENQSITDYWFFLGYSSWGWDQLLNEIAEGAWNLSDHSMGHLDWPLS